MMSIIPYSLFPSCPDPLSPTSTDKIIGHSSVRRISRSREATDTLSCHIGEANGDKRNNIIVNSRLKESPAMGRMIPLKLQLSEQRRSESNLNSYPPTITPTTPFISTSSPTTSRKARPGPVTDLIIIPYTQEEWKIVMEEVKILYLKGQYKHCSMRCKQILENIKDAVSIFNRHVLHQYLTDTRTKHTLFTPSISASFRPAAWK
jgi:hypothetical protein